MELIDKNKNKPTTGFATDAIHWGYNPSSHQGSLTPPVYMTSTFAFESAEQGASIFGGEEKGYFYSRISNPTVALLEERIARLEGAEAGVATSSGMGAICSVFWSLIQHGDELVVDQTLYGCTYAFFRTLVEKFGIKILAVDMADLKAVEQAISPKTRLVFFETPANPTLRLVDIAAVSSLAHKHEAIVIVDNTFCTPYLQRPLDFGADVIVHSATKYLGGHGDLIAGVAVGSAEMMENVRLSGLKDLTGAALSPFDASQVLRGLKTLEIRMDRHSQSADKVARYLASHSAIETVYYPGLESFPQHELAKRQMSQFGGLIAFEVKGGIEAGKALMNSLKLATLAVSLGDAETLIQHPASMTHAPYEEDVRRTAGISDGLVRLSVGLECVDDIIADLDQGLRQEYIEIAQAG